MGEDGQLVKEFTKPGHIPRLRFAGELPSEFSARSSATTRLLLVSVNSSSGTVGEDSQYAVGGYDQVYLRTQKAVKHCAHCPILATGGRTRI